MTKLKYYTLVILNNAGKRQLREIEIAKIFFTDTFADFSVIEEVSDTLIQKQLLETYQNNLGNSSLFAQRCLLCFISWQIEQVCLSLAQKFGNLHGFSRHDLLPYVLDDDGSLQTSTTYKCFSREILETFDPDKSNLNTWTNRKVKQHREINKFLLECGLYFVTDWAILNDTRPQQLKNILGEFHSLTNSEIAETQKLLEAYHKIYRTERCRQQADSKTKGRCHPPTIQQLEEMTEILKTKGIDSISTKTIMQKLQSLADKLRQYRIHVRSGSLFTVSLDAELNENFTFIEQIYDPNSENIIIEADTTTEFLEIYRAQFLNCLDNSLNTVIESRVKKLQNKDTDKANKFLTALQLFHCQRLSMGNIAKQLGLRAQDAVARLLKLKEFRADVRQEILVKLQEQVIELAQKYSTPKQLKILEAQIKEVLDEQIINVISQAELEAATMQSNVTISEFSKRLCRLLNDRVKIINS
ncbi:hypothetical protein [Calothrix sp. PCC 7507]|uniref:hypothetical protein n=1 Tax=Calothrix sp. PCC 7507 TaxID=99598 RepID=UPI00029EF488|nr:hypothetical protein [Calothrix sp. PCC 7507]AFY31634.1 hypothetical protein Cal7507_1160 [Calothrix sp. PCC 7507]